MSDPVAVEAAAMSRRWAGWCLAFLASLVFWGFALALFLPLTPLAVTLSLLVAGLALLRARLLHAAAHFEAQS